MDEDGAAAGGGEGSVDKAAGDVAGRRLPYMY